MSRSDIQMTNIQHSTTMGNNFCNQKKSGFLDKCKKRSLLSPIQFVHSKSEYTFQPEESRDNFQDLTQIVLNRQSSTNNGSSQSSSFGCNKFSSDFSRHFAFLKKCPEVVKNQS